MGLKRRVRVRVHLVDVDASFEGVLVRRDSYGLELIAGEMLETSTDRHVLDSERVVIKHDRVLAYEVLRG